MNNINAYPLWTALVTPLSSNGKIDFESLTNIVRAQERAKNGLLVLGSTGEALNLNLENKKAIIGHVISLKPTTPIMVGVGGHLLEECVSWIQYLETLPVHAYLMVTPIYAKPGAKGQTAWFKTLLDASSRPAMIYNVPGRSATPLSVEAVKNLCSHKNFWSIKEASGSVERFKEYLAAAGGKGVFCGDDALMPDFANAGSCGLVSVASNAWPAETNLYVTQCLTKKFDAKELWTKASNSLFITSNPTPVKTLMYEQKVINTPYMIAPLSHEDMPGMDIVLEANRHVQTWYKGQF